MARKNFCEEVGCDAVALYRSGMRAAITRGMRDGVLGGIREAERGPVRRYATPGKQATDAEETRVPLHPRIGEALSLSR